MNLKEQVAQLEAAKEAAQSYAAKFKTQASSEGLENIADDFIAGAKWAIEKLQTPQPEEVKEDADLVTIYGKFAIVPNQPEQFPYRLELQTGYGSFFFVSGSYMHCSDVQSEITALD